MQKENIFSNLTRNDIMEPTKLEECVNIFESYNDADFIFTDFKCINEKEQLIKNSFLFKFQSFRGFLIQKSADIYSLKSNSIQNELVKANFIGTSSVAFSANKIT